MALNLPSSPPTSWQSCSRCEYSLSRKLVRAKQGRVSLSTQNLPWLRRQSISSSPSRWWMQCCSNWAVVPPSTSSTLVCRSWNLSSTSGYRCTLKRRKGKVRQLSSTSPSCPLPSTTSGLIYTLKSSGCPQSACVSACGLTMRLLTRHTRWKLSTWLAVIYPIRQWAAVFLICSISRGRSRLRATRAMGTLKVRLSLRAGPKMLATVRREDCLRDFLSLPARIIKISCRTRHLNCQLNSPKTANSHHAVICGSSFSSRLSAFFAISSSARRISRFLLSTSVFWMGFRSRRVGQISSESSSISMGSALSSWRGTVSRRRGMKRERRQRRWLRTWRGVRVVMQVARRSQSSPKTLRPSRRRRFSTSVQCLRSPFAMNSIIEILADLAFRHTLDQIGNWRQLNNLSKTNRNGGCVSNLWDELEGGGIGSWVGLGGYKFLLYNFYTIGRFKMAVSIWFFLKFKLTPTSYFTSTLKNPLPSFPSLQLKSQFPTPFPQYSLSNTSKWLNCLSPCWEGTAAILQDGGVRLFQFSQCPKVGQFFEQQAEKSFIKEKTRHLPLLHQQRRKRLLRILRIREIERQRSLHVPLTRLLHKVRILEVFSDHQYHSCAVNLNKFAEFQRSAPLGGGLADWEQGVDGLKSSVGGEFSEVHEIGDIEVAVLVGDESVPNLSGEYNEPLRSLGVAGMTDKIEEKPQIGLMLEIFRELPLHVSLQPLHPPLQHLLHPQQHPASNCIQPGAFLGQAPSALDLTLLIFYIIPILVSKYDPVLLQHIFFETDFMVGQQFLHGAGGGDGSGEFLLVDARLPLPLGGHKRHLVQTIQVLHRMH